MKIAHTVLKRVFVLVMAAAMLLAFMPAAAFAGEGASGTDKITLTQTVGDIVITLTADKGVFPDNVTLSAEEITNKSDVGKIEEAVGDAAGPDERVTETRSFDIKVLTAAKEEVQPDTSAGSIELSFANVVTKDTNGDAKNIDVYHVSDAMTAAEPVATAVDTASDSVSISPKHFSIYTVTVTVDETASSTAGIKYFEGATKATSYFEIENQASLEAYAKIINGGAATPVVAIEYINEDGVTWIADATDFSQFSMDAKLMNDIVLTGYGSGQKNWTPIGKNAEHKFSATFDGNGHAISGFYASGTTYTGLFGYVSGGTIKDLSAAGTVTAADNYAGGIAGYLNGGSIIRCHSDAAVTTSLNYAGGIAGGADGNFIINMCGSGGNVTALSCAGGIAGFVDETASSAIIRNCFNTGTVSVDDGYDAGGIVGFAEGVIAYQPEIENCFNQGTIQGRQSIGGIIGFGVYTNVKGCYNSGTITGIDTGSSSSSYVGGICGAVNVAAISYCVNAGVVSGSKVVGGICGYLWIEQLYSTTAASTVEYCTNNGKVTAAGSVSAGGIYGKSVIDTNGIGTFNTISNCMTNQNVNGADFQAGGDFATTYNSTTYTVGYIGGNSHAMGNNGAYTNITNVTSYARITDTVYTEMLAYKNAAFGVGSDYLVWSYQGTWQGVTGTEDAPVFIAPSAEYQSMLTGGGTKISPYLISSKEDLIYMRNTVNAGGTIVGSESSLPAQTAYYQLTADIDAGKDSWVPIGDQTHPFRGMFDGNGKSVKITIAYTSGSYAGLFGKVAGSAKNPDDGKDTVIEGLTVIGTITRNANTGTLYAGGIAGLADTNVTFRGCSSSVVIDSASEEIYDTDCYAGGIVGVMQNGCLIDRCENHGAISHAAYAGGIAGGALTNDNIVRNSFNLAEINAYLAYHAGGIVCSNSSAIYNCYNRGDVSAALLYYGGIAGINNGTVANVITTLGPAIGSGTTTGTNVFSDINLYNSENTKALNTWAHANEYRLYSGWVTNALYPAFDSMNGDYHFTIDGSALYLNGAWVQIDNGGIIEDTDHDGDFNDESNSYSYGMDKIDTIYGGSKSADYVGDVHITLDGKSMKAIYGGGNGYNVDGNTVIAIKSGTVDFVFGGGFNGNITGSTTISMSGGTAKCIFGGGSSGNVGSGSTINLSGGTVITMVSGQCQLAGLVIGNKTVNVSGSPSISKGTTEGYGIMLNTLTNRYVKITGALTGEKGSIVLTSPDKAADGTIIAKAAYTFVPHETTPITSADPFAIPGHGLKVTANSVAIGPAYAITYDENGGSDVPDSSYTYGTGKSLPTATDITKENYRFAGWYVTGDENQTIVTEITAAEVGSRSFTAKWTGNEYTVAYELDGGIAGTNAPVTGNYGTEFALSAPSKLGYRFNGWTLSGSNANYDIAKWGNTGGNATNAISANTNFGADSSIIYLKNLSSTEGGNVTLTAHWVFNIIAGGGSNGGTNIVNIDLGGGSAGAVLPTASGKDVVMEVPAPTKKDSTFLGWMVSGGLDSSTARWGTTDKPNNPITEKTLCVNGNSSVYFVNLGTSIKLTAVWAENKPAENPATNKVGAKWHRGIYEYAVTKAAKDGAMGKVVITGLRTNDYSSIRVLDSISINGLKYQVAGIAADAFRGNSHIRQIIIGGDVGFIGDKAFYHCRNLDKVIIRTTELKSVGSLAFRGCRRGMEFYLQSSNFEDYKALLKGRVPMGREFIKI